jgi:hypothetical protein
MLNASPTVFKCKRLQLQIAKNKSNLLIFAPAKICHPTLNYYANKLVRRTIYTHFFAFSGADRKPPREKMCINLVILFLLLRNSLLRFLFSKKVSGKNGKRPPPLIKLLYRRVHPEIRPAQGYSDRWPAFYDGRNSNVGLRTLTLCAG